MRIATLVVAFSLLLSVFAFAQNQPAAPQAPAAGQPRQPLSPRGTAEFTFADGKKITVDYGRPFMRGRKIMGGLVPFGQVWRTGANAATGFVTDSNLDISGTHVPAGKYTLYTIPGATSWTIIINKQTGQWGTMYDASQDLARIEAKPVSLATPVDQFTISFEKQSPASTVMKLEWENTSVPLLIKEAQ